MTDKILVVSLKGGVGKTKVTAELAKALTRRGLKVGVLDCDYHAPNIPTEFNCEGVKPTRESGNRILPPLVNGIRILSWGMIFPPDSAVMIEDSQVEKDDLLKVRELWVKGETARGLKYLDHLIAHPGGAMEHMKLLLEDGAVSWGDIDYLVVDTPPESTGVIRVALEAQHVKGAIIVCHPSRVSLADTRRTVDLFRKRSLPILGLLSNQGSQNGQNRYDLTDQDMEAFAGEKGIPYIAAIPHTTDLSPHFDRVARFVVEAQAVILPPPPKEEGWKETEKDLRLMSRLLNSLKPEASKG